MVAAVSNRLSGRSTEVAPTPPTNSHTSHLTSAELAGCMVRGSAFSGTVGCSYPDETARFNPAAPGGWHPMFHLSNKHAFSGDTSGPACQDGGSAAAK